MVNMKIFSDLPILYNYLSTERSLRTYLKKKALLHYYIFNILNNYLNIII